ncbi:DUF6114 domain-containing protein [Nocardioides nematodiphilus]|uniref:DUF6114 domain-containing protein n=1 Tax=Nocardioides nematodiphilus TaxID=2849669 RepID=UPI001CD9D6E8|nr:DUF6114 domain-containing protein [Nocardioides nematodiphilus]MCA1983325.1 DUF6114 domain-containing protein [Nocardioides nematodiphilus]
MATKARREARILFAAFRRSRPFWGGLWTIVAGAWIVKVMSFPLGIALNGGWSYSAGYVVGGSLIVFGVVAWLAPNYRMLAGVVAFLLAIAAFPVADLGGYLVGSLLGIVGSSMIIAWGDKPARLERGRRRKRTRAA